MFLENKTIRNNSRILYSRLVVRNSNIAQHSSSKDGSSLKDIKLHVLNTTLFPKRTLICDLDLIEAFREQDDRRKLE
jgi:hypothetical protein